VRGSARNAANGRGHTGNWRASACCTCPYACAIFLSVHFGNYLTYRASPVVSWPPALRMDSVAWPDRREPRLVVRVGTVDPVPRSQASDFRSTIHGCAARLLPRPVGILAIALRAARRRGQFDRGLASSGTRPCQAHRKKPPLPPTTGRRPAGLLPQSSPAQGRRQIRLRTGCSRPACPSGPGSLRT
jgi:hypothetical protein